MSNLIECQISRLVCYKKGKTSCVKRAAAKITRPEMHHRDRSRFGTRFTGWFIKADIQSKSSNVRTNKTVNRYRRKRPKVDASIFDSLPSHTPRSDASEKREENNASTFGRFRLSTSFESSPVSVKKYLFT